MRAKLQKALGRGRHLSARELADVVRRRTRAALRAKAQERAAKKLGLERDAPELLAQVVSGASSAASAVALLESSAGRLPLPVDTVASPDLLARADQACAGLWTVFGQRQVPLGRTPDWQGDFVSGKRWEAEVPSRQQPIVRNDGSDVKIPWELSRLQHLPVVGQAFAFTGEARYRDLIALQLRDWITRNPPGFGINWTCAMEVALRAVSISWAFELVRRDPMVGVDLRGRVFWSLFAHGHYLLGHLEDDAVTPGNHYLADLLGLIWLGTLYPAFEGADRWREEGLTLLLEQLELQVLPDGGDFEASLPYHQLVLEMLRLGLNVLQANRQRAPELREAVERMDQFVGALRKPDGSLPQIGDADGGQASLLGLHTAAGKETSRSFADAGFACHNDGELYLLFCATPVGQNGQGGHGHNDKLSFELFHRGDLITDAGSYAYTGDPAARDSFRATAAHATLQLDDREQNPIPLPRDVFFLPETAHARLTHFEAAEGRFTCEGEHRGYWPILHRRRLILAAQRIQLIDTLSGASAETHQLTLRFPLAVGLAARCDGRRVEVTRGGQLVLTLQSGPETPDLEWSLEPGWYSPVYGTKEPRPVAVARCRRAIPAEITTLLTLPGGPDRPAPTARR